MDTETGSEPERKPQGPIPSEESDTDISLYREALPAYESGSPLEGENRPIPVSENNIAVNYIHTGDENEARDAEALPGEIQIELRSFTGQIIDTISISLLTRDTYKSIVETITASNLEGFSQRVNQSSAFLSASKLEKILALAGSQGATVKTALKGITPRQRADAYHEKLLVKPNNEQLRNEVLSQLQHANTLFLIRQGFELSRQRGTSVIMAPAGEGAIIEAIHLQRGPNQGIIWITEEKAEEEITLTNSRDMIWTPQTKEFSKGSQDKLALLTALVEGKAQLEEQVLMFQRLDDSSNLDGFRLRYPKSMFRWLTEDMLGSIRALPVEQRQTLIHVTELAMKLAVESIEGQSIGATFIIAEYKEVAPFLKPKLINPFSPDKHSIFNDHLIESIRAYASADGAVVISPNGAIHASGVYVTARTDHIEGLEQRGARHRSAAAITAETSAVAIVISESTGDVTLMSKGKPILELPKL